MHSIKLLTYTVIYLLPISLSQKNLVRECPPSPKYNEIYRKACHNCYEKQYSSSVSEILNNVASIEIDFYDSQAVTTGTGGVKNEWYVRHNAVGTNDNCCGNSGNGYLSDCLGSIAAWSDSHPNHPVITVFLDKKQAWGDDDEGRDPIDLDNLILSKIPRTKIFAPSDLKGSFPTLRAAANNKAWPALDDLKGKLVFVLTGGETLNHNATQHEYVIKRVFDTLRGNDAILFVAPDADETSDIQGAPNQFSDETSKWVVFYNVEAGNETIAPLIYSNGFISRVWQASEDDATYRRLIKETVHFIALYKYKENSFNNSKMTAEFFPCIPSPIPNPLHHHHKRGRDCEHGEWATSDADGHHHHKRGRDCEHKQWATDDVAGHHHHKRGSDCEHGEWATDEQRRP